MNAVTQLSPPPTIATSPPIPSHIPTPLSPTPIVPHQRVPSLIFPTPTPAQHELSATTIPPITQITPFEPAHFQLHVHYLSSVTLATTSCRSRTRTPRSHNSPLCQRLPNSHPHSNALPSLSPIPTSPQHPLQRTALRRNKGGTVSQHPPPQQIRTHSHTPTHLIHHQVFTVYRPSIQFTSDSGATDIILHQSDSHVLINYTHYDDPSCSPRFDVANDHSIYPLGTDYFCLPSSNLRLVAYVFSDHVLADNLFGLAPIINLGYSATYSSSGLTIRDPNHHVVIYGTKYDNIWKFSLPKPPTRSANIVVRHEQSAELVLYASASFGSPSYANFYHAANMGWFTNYPDLTPKMIRQNKPHSPATGLGHTTTSRSSVRFTRPRPTSHDTTASSTTPHFPHGLYIEPHHSESSGLNETLHYYDLI